MQLIKKDSVTLAYEDINPGAQQPILFAHGWSCDHTAFAQQAKFFSSTYRVISVDFRGHGKSDAPHQDYTMAGYADDLAWLCAELKLIKPVVVGHSMGGNVALELAARHPKVPASIFLIDSVIFPTQAFRDSLRPVLEAMHEPNYAEVVRHVMSSLCLPADGEPQRSELISSLPTAPAHVLASAFKNHILEYDSTPAATGCCVPVAYVGAAVAIADLDHLRSLTPQLVTAQTLGSGHFSLVFVPDQINAMLTRFLSSYSSESKDGQTA